VAILQWNTAATISGAKARAKGKFMGGKPEAARRSPLVGPCATLKYPMNANLNMSHVCIDWVEGMALPSLFPISDRH
jgi:hypothetical protein